MYSGPRLNRLRKILSSRGSKWLNYYFSSVFGLKSRFSVQNDHFWSTKVKTIKNDSPKLALLVQKNYFWPKTVIPIKISLMWKSNHFEINDFNMIFILGCQNESLLISRLVFWLVERHISFCIWTFRTLVSDLTLDKNMDQFEVQVS